MHIDRPDLDVALEAFAFGGHGVVIGPPGVGKTVAMRGLAQKHAMALGSPCLFLPVDALGVESEEELAGELGVNVDLIDYLCEQSRRHGGTRGLVVVDSFDSARSEKTRRLFLSLVRRMIRGLKDKWSVVVSIRTYDAANSAELLDLFPSASEEPAPAKFRLEDVTCRHLCVPKLVPDEIQQVESCIPGLVELYSRASEDLARLMEIPFNLWLLERLTASGVNVTDLSAVQSGAELLHMFWEHRAAGRQGNAVARSVLSTLATRMVEQRTLSLRAADVYRDEWQEEWDRLLSEEVLTRVGMSRQRVSFSHNILFDYAVSVLLVDDSPHGFMTFVAADPARPVFLRPSVDFYLVRAWHRDRELFWQITRGMLQSDDTRLSLLARLLPTKTLATEARAPDELAPMSDAAVSGEAWAVTMSAHVLQALRALEITRDALWIALAERLASFPRREWAWNLAKMTTEILERAEAAGDDEVLSSCARTGRTVLAWVLSERKKPDMQWVDSVGCQWAIRIVVMTYGWDVKTARSLLEQVLSLVNEPGFPILYLFRLTDELHRVWPHDPHLAEATYVALFAHEETSREITEFGTPVLPLSSNRRQDYEICRLNLVKHFPAFLDRDPVIAARAAVVSLNRFVVENHIVGHLREGVSLRDLPEPFTFRGREVSFISDMSHIWGQSHHPDEPVAMATALSDFMVRMAQHPDKQQVLRSLVDVYVEHASVAFVWSHLLETASKSPEALALDLHELCVARPIQMSSDTVYALGRFIESAAPHFSPAQLLSIEKSILTLPEGAEDEDNRGALTRRRDRLLARLPKSALSTEPGQAIRKALEDEDSLPPNEPLVRFHSEHVPFGVDDYLAEQGADMARTENAALRKLSEALDPFVTQWRSGKPTTDAIDSVLPAARGLHEALAKDTGADPPVVDQAWTDLASCAEAISRGVADAADEAFCLARDILLSCANHRLPEYREGIDDEYVSPTWSPAPRNEAAQGVPALVSVRTDPELEAAIHRLVEDQVPSVRMLVVGRLHLVQRNAPEFFWRLINHVPEHESNHVVLVSLCHVLEWTARREEARTVKVLKKLASVAARPSAADDLAGSFLHILTGLALVRENEWAAAQLERTLAPPAENPRGVQRAVFHALQYVTPQFATSHMSATMDRALEWLSRQLDAVSGSIAVLHAAQQQLGKPDPQKRETASELYRAVDEVVTRVYFSSGVFERQDGQGQSVRPDQQREFCLKTKPLLDKVLAFAEEQHGALLAPTAHHLMEYLVGVLRYDPHWVLSTASRASKASKVHGYDLDSMAMSEVVKLTNTVLADFRQEVREGQALQDLLDLLDVFAKAGHADAARLLWRLDEIFR